MKISTLTIEMAANVARLRQDMDRAQKTVDTAMGGIKSAAKAAVGALAALGVGLSVSAFAGWVRGAIDAADASIKLARSAGILGKEVEGASLAFRQSGLSDDDLVKVMTRLNQQVAEGSRAFEAMGLSTRNADGSLKGARQMLGEVSDKLKTYEEGARKSALITELFGEKLGPKMASLLALGEEGLASFDDMAKRLGLTLDDETKVAAEQFNDTLDLMGRAGQGVARQVAAQLLPTLNSLAGELFRSMTEGDRLARVSEFLAGTMKGLYSIAVGLVTVFQTVVKVLGGFGSAIAAILSGDFGAIKFIVADLGTEVSDNWQSAGASIQRVWTGAGDATVAALAASTRAARDAAPAVADVARANKAAADEARRLAREQAEAERAMKALADLRARVSEMTDRAADTYFASAAAVMAANAALRDEIALIGLDESARRALLLTKEEQIVADRELLLISYQTAGASRDTLAALEQEIRLRRQRLDLLRQRGMAEEDQERLQKHLEVAKKTQAEWDKTWDQVAQSMTDALIGGGVRTKDLLQNMFKTLVLRPAIEPIMKSAAGAVGNLIAGLLPSFDGGGYTGGGARSGGLDGRGGYLAMLHPRETVIDHTKGGGAGGNHINIVINNTIGDVATQSQVVSGMQVVRSQIMGELQRSARYGGALSA